MSFKHGNFRVLPAQEAAYDPDARLFGDLKARTVHSAPTEPEARLDRPSHDFQGRVAVEGGGGLGEGARAPSADALKAAPDLHLSLENPFEGTSLQGYDSLAYDAGGLII